MKFLCFQAIENFKPACLSELSGVLHLSWNDLSVRRDVESPETDMAGELDRILFSNHVTSAAN